jgi:hypothetical protein
MGTLLDTAAADGRVRSRRRSGRAGSSPPRGHTTSYAAPHIAELLAGAGRTEDAVAVLEQHAPADSHALAAYLIGLGRISEGVAVLQETSPRSAVRPSAGPWHDERPF